MSEETERKSLSSIGADLFKVLLDAEAAKAAEDDERLNEAITKRVFDGLNSQQAEWELSGSKGGKIKVIAYADKSSVNEFVCREITPDEAIASALRYDNAPQVLAETAAAFAEMAERLMARAVSMQRSAAQADAPSADAPTDRRFAEAQAATVVLLGEIIRLDMYAEISPRARAYAHRVLGNINDTLAG